MTAAAIPIITDCDDTRRPIPGNQGIWVGISCEFVEFLLLFSVYFVARVHNPAAFEAGPGQLSTLAGTVVTLLMVTSSWFLACSVVCMRGGRRHASLRWLLAGTVTAIGYPIVKVLEIRWNLAHGISGDSGIFYTVYYYLTFTHAVHGVWGILGMLWVSANHLAGSYTAQDHSGLEALASYWHATDIIWLIIFPLCYVLA